jgi:predicted dehydrogenase
VLVEKPLAVTVAECVRVQRAAGRAGRVVGVAENVRREAGYRLARAAIQSGLLGEVRLLIDYACSGGDAILLTPWRHRKFTGGTLLDVMVHTGDLIEYLAGRVERVAGRIRLAEPVRRSRGDPGPAAQLGQPQGWSGGGVRENWLTT